jgi:hypothetical protein
MFHGSAPEVAYEEYTHPLPAGGRGGRIVHHRLWSHAANQKTAASFAACFYVVRSVNAALLSVVFHLAAGLRCGQVGVAVAFFVAQLPPELISLVSVGALRFVCLLSWRVCS